MARDPRPLSDDDRALLETMAGWLGQRRLTVPAVLFIESVKPLHFVGSQMLVFLEPMVHAFTSGKNYTRFTKLMEDQDALEAFLVMIEGEGAKQQKTGAKKA